MLPLIAVLLAATPASSTPSLLAPASGWHLSARLLVAQAPTPPPLPAPELARDPELEGRIRDLTQRVGLLQDEIRGINANWPPGSLALAITGYVLAPLVLVGIPLMLFGVGGLGESPDDSEAQTLLGVGLGLTVAGMVGAGLIVGGVITGVKHSNVQRARRDALVRERIRLEDELRDLKARRGAAQVRRWTPRPTVPLVALRF